MYDNIASTNMCNLLDRASWSDQTDTELIRRPSSRPWILDCHYHMHDRLPDSSLTESETKLGIDMKLNK